MNELNELMRNLTSVMLWPFAVWPPLVSLVLLSVVLGIGMAIVFRYTSPQRRLRRVADLSRAEVLAIKLFKDDPLAMFRALGRLLRHTGLRLWYSVPPMLVMFVPFVLLLTHLAVWYEYRPLAVGEPAVVELQLGDGAWQQYHDTRLEASPAIDVETKPLRDSHDKTIYWRIRATEPASTDLRWQLGPEEVQKHVEIADARDAFRPVSVRRAGTGWWDRLLHPGEDAFATDSSVRGVTVHYQQRSTPVFGWDVPWWATLLVVSIVAAMLVRPLVNVQF